jgi:hypothetical protein|tara:strand:- start:4 stop:231 length:228 start_codon:yes stop_codon:yes gene_type:complete
MPPLTGDFMPDANDYKDRIEKILNEAIIANQEQLLGGVDTLPEYKYMLGIHHTLTDMKDRINTELKKLIKETWSE